jgi:hypothetical protein
MTRPKPAGGEQLAISCTALAQACDVSDNIVSGWIKRRQVRVIKLGPRIFRVPISERERILAGGIGPPGSAYPDSPTPVASDP